jgi:glucan biosynthesis protein C
MPDDDRYHGLDNLRAIMMWLGIVLHVGMSYSEARTAVPVHDETHSMLADVALAFIHAFRMPVFFVIAGFLGAMLLERRGPRAFLVHRMKRLALPFAVFWPLLYVATGIAMLAFLNRMAFGRWGLSEAALPASVPREPLTMHLWFLWMLIWFCVATALLARAPRAPFAAGAALLARLGAAWWGFVPLTLPLLAAAAAYPQGLLIVHGAFLPPWQEWLHHALFYVFGLALWTHRAVLLPHYERHWGRYAWAGLPFFLAAGALYRMDAHWASIAFAYNALAWLWSFAWIGLAMRVLARRHAALAYLADSAYWVYLVHLPIAVAISAVLYQQPLPALAKILVNLVITTAVCLWSYRLLVRHTWVGLLLNGRRHPRRAGSAPVAPAAAAH